MARVSIGGDALRIVAGTFYRDGEWIFWDVQDGSHAVVVERSGSARVIASTTIR